MPAHAFGEGLATGRCSVAFPGAGVLAQAGRVRLRAAFRGLPPARLPFPRPAAASTITAVVTVLAVHAAG